MFPKDVPADNGRAGTSVTYRAIPRSIRYMQTRGMFCVERLKGADPDTERLSPLRKSRDDYWERTGAAADMSRAPRSVMLSYRLLYPFIFLFRLY